MKLETKSYEPYFIFGNYLIKCGNVVENTDEMPALCMYVIVSNEDINHVFVTEITNTRIKGISYKKYNYDKEEYIFAEFDIYINTISLILDVASITVLD